MLLKIALICVSGLIVDALFIRTEYAGKMGLATLLKGIASLFFVALGYVCFAYRPSSFGINIFYGLVLGLIGDVLLNMRNLFTGKPSMIVFAVGILAFLGGHFFYIAALLARCPQSLISDLIVTLIVAVIAIPPLMRSIKAPSTGLKIFGYVYLIVVSAMFSCAAVILIKTGSSLLNITFAAGALLFLVSDFIMIYYSFGKKIKPLRAINLLCYYVGQLLIAMSMLFV